VKGLLLATLILTEWGTFTCSTVHCAQAPREGLDGYWSAPILVVTKKNVPVLVLTCQAVSGQPYTWDCRNGERPTRRVSDEDLWAAVPLMGADGE